MTTYYTYIDGPLGRTMLSSDGHSLTGLYLAGQKYERIPGDDWIEEPSLPLFVQASEQLAEYFAGSRTTFDLPVSPSGTPFQREVWSCLQDIPYGTRQSYGAVATAVGRPQAFRAVGAAIGRNPISIIIPCHRVLGKSGSLTGYAGGLERKQVLLELEAEPQAVPEMQARKRVAP